MQRNLSRLEEFANGYKDLFKDKRLFTGFLGSLQGIIASKSLSVSQIASHSSLLGSSIHAERRIRRLVHNNNTRAELSADSLCEQLTAEGAKRLAGEQEVMLILDGSDLRKPFASCMEYLDTVRDLKGKPVSGFHTLNVLAIGKSGQRVIVYHHSFSTLEPNFKSVSHEHKKALEAVSKALHKQGVGRLIWVMDREFDDIKVMQQLQQAGDCFVIRVQHTNRRCLHKHTPSSLGKALDAAPLLAQAYLERRVLEPQAKRHKHKLMKVDLAATSVELQAVLGLAVCVMQVRPPQQSQGWVLISNLHLKQGHEAALLERLLALYKQRWAIEDLFAWSKDVLAWETVQLMSFEALKTLVAFAWIAAAFLHDLGRDAQDAHVQLLVKLGASYPQARATPKTLATGLAHLASFLLVSQHAQYLSPKHSLDDLIQNLFPLA